MREIGPFSDGVVVGSALIDLLAGFGDNKDIFAHIRSLINSMAKALTGDYS